MLVLSRKVNESLLIGDDIVITIIDMRQGGKSLNGCAVKIGIQAPKHISVMRDELVRNEKGDDEREHE